LGLKYFILKLIEGIVK